MSSIIFTYYKPPIQAVDLPLAQGISTVLESPETLIETALDGVWHIIGRFGYAARELLNVGRGGPPKKGMN